MEYFTSNSEFDLVKRVQITNETPVYNLFEGVNSVLRNDFWSWYLGTQSVDWDLVNGIYDSELEDTYFKSINGALSTSFGPKATQKNPNPTFHKMKLTGTLTPEFDLLLHEVYRYLDTLYPDHYDYTEILTPNELNSMISNASAIVDYSPNLKFFDLLSKSFGITSNGVIDKEALKLKIRDLKSNAFRRKFYGSKLGYKMFGSSVFNNISIFPLGTYLPLSPEDIINNTYQDLPPSSHNINVRSNLYKNKFKLIDWTGESRQVSSELDNNIYCKFYSVPCFDYQVFLLSENNGDLEEFNSINSNNYFVSDHFDLNDTVYIRNKTTSLVKSSKTITDTLISTYENSTRPLNFLTLSKRCPIKYTTSYLLGTWNDFFASLTPSDITLMRDTLADSFDTFVNIASRSLNVTATNSVEFLYRIFNRINDVNSDASIAKFKNFKSVSSPYNTGLLFVEPSTVLDMYTEGYSAHIIFSQNGDFLGYETDAPTISQNSTINIGDVISTSNFSEGFDEKHSLIKVSSLNLGEVYFTSNPVSSYLQDPSIGFNCPEVLESSSIYGALLLSQDGETRVFVQGELNLKVKTQSLYTVPNGGKFSITAIPENLTDELCKLIYPLPYNDIMEKLFEQQGLLLIDSRRVEAQAEIDKLNSELTFLKINRAKLIEVGNSETNEETFSIFTGCFIEKFYKIFGDFTEIVNSEGVYFWHEMITYYGALIDYIDFGTYSVLPIISYGSVATNTNNGFFAEVKTETITGQKFQYLDLIESYITKSNSFLLTEKTPGFLTETTKKQFSYTSIGNNSTISDIVSYDIEIEGTVVDSDDERVTIKFSTEASIHDMQSLTIGDKLFGAGVKAGTYVIDIGDDFITVSDKLLKDGDILFTFTVSFSCAGKDLSDEFDFYRTQLKDTGLLKLANPFENGVWPSAEWPRVSSSFVEGLVDVSLFNIYEPTFYRVMKGTHSKELSYNGVSPSNYLIPSTIKFNNDLFAEINLNRTIPLENRMGSKLNLCNVEFIDYITNSLSDISRGTDIVNCGTQLSMQTDISGYFTQVAGQTYTDPSIKLYFQTFNSEDGLKIPSYAQIGSNGNGRYNWFKSSDDNVSPMVYGGSFFDGQIDGLENKYTDLITNKGIFSKRSVWASRTETELGAKDNSLNEMRYVEKALFEIALGEYDIQYSFAEESNLSNKTHTIQCNFYRQKYDNLKFIIESSEKEAIKLISNKFENLNILTEINKSSIIEDTTGVQPYKLGINNLNKFYLNEIVYCGVWEPTVYNNSVVYPTIEQNYIDNIDTTLFYFTVENGKTLNFNNGLTTLKIENNSLLIFTKNALGGFYWKPTNFVLGGSNYPTAIQSDTVQAKDSFNIMCKNISGNYFVDSSSTVVIDTVDLFKSNFSTYSQDITNLFDESKCYVYVCLFDGLDKNGGTAYDTSKSTVFSAGSYIAVIYDKYCDQLRFFKLNTNTRFVSSLQFDMPPKMSITEFRFLTGANTQFSNTNIRSKVSNSVASIELPKPFLTNGSVDIKVIVDGGFISKGYRLVNSQVDESNIVYFNISNSAIYYDSVLGYFYVQSFEYKSVEGTYVKFGTTLENFYIYFSDPSYFKNTLKNYGTYKLEKTQTSGSSLVDYSPVVSQIEGFTSLFDKLSNEDVILQVKEVITRSFYNALYNNIGFDTHTKLSVDVSSVNSDFTQFIVVPSSTDTLSQIDLKTKINNLWPSSVVDNESTLVFDKEVEIDSDGVEIISDILLRNFGVEETYKCPKLSNVIGNVSSDSITQETTDTSSMEIVENKFFKNNLVMLASVNPESPNKLVSYGNENIFAKVLSTIQANDSVEAIVSLSSNLENSKTISISLRNASFAPTGIYPLPTYIAFNGTTFVAGTNDGYVYYKNGIDSLASLASEIILDISPVRIGSGNPISPATYGSTNSSLQVIDWDDDESKWFFSYDLKNGSEEITVMYESTSLLSFNSAYSETEVVSLPTDFNINNYASNQSINASTGLTLPENVLVEDWVAHPTNPVDAQNGAVAKKSFYRVNKLTGDKVLIRGKYIFFKSYTKTTTGELTSKKYWKKAVLSREYNITKIWLEQQGDNELRYERVVQALTGMREILLEQYNYVNANVVNAEVKATTISAYNFINSMSIATYENFIVALALPAGVSYSNIYKVRIPETTTDSNYRLVTNSTFASFSNTVVTTDINIVAKPFSYKYSDYIPEGSPDGIADTQSAYLDYLSDISSYILNDSHKQEIISGYIDSVTLTNSFLILKTTFDTVSYFPISSSYSVSDIENHENWITAQAINSDVIYNSISSPVNLYAISSTGKLVVLGTDVQNNEKHIYEINSFATSEDTKVMAGYWRKKSEITAYEGTSVVEDSNLVTRKKYIPAYNSLTDINYPCILVSKDDENFQPAFFGISVSNPTKEYSIGVGFAGYKVNKVIYENGEYRAFLSNFAGVPYNNYLRAFSDNLNNWDWVTPSSSEYVTQFTNSKIIQFSDDGTIPSSVVFNPALVDGSGNVTVVGNKKFSLTSAYALLGSDIKVKSVNDSSIILDQNLMLTARGKGNINVLLSVKTMESIVNQADYLDTNLLSECINSKGNFKVATISEVPSFYNADKVYQYREMLSTEDHEEKVLVPFVAVDGSVTQIVTTQSFIAQIYDDTYSYGYPSVAEDVSDMSFYDYTSYIDINNDLAYTVKPLTNSKGNNIILCNENGEVLVNREVQDMGKKVISFYEEFTNNSSVLTYALFAGSLKYSSVNEASKYGVKIKNNALTYLFNELNLSITQMNNDLNNPFMKIKSSNTLLPAITEFLYSFDSENIAKYISDYRILDINTYTYDSDGNITNTITVPVEDQYENLNGFIYDSINNRFNFKGKINLTSSVTVPYVFFGTDVKVSYNPSIKTNSSGVLTLNDSLSGIYMNNLGYGGNSTNLDETFSTLPWSIDTDAFLEMDLYNSFGEPVYLVSKYGEKINHDEGTLFVNPNSGSVPVTYEDMKYSTKTIVVSQKTDYLVGAIPTSKIVSATSNIYKPEDSAYTLVLTNEMAPVNRDKVTGLIENQDTTKGQAILYKGIELVETGVTYSIDFGVYTTLGMTIDLLGNYIVTYWNDSQENLSEKATIKINALVSGKIVSSASVTYLEYVVTDTSAIVDLFPSTTSDESDMNDLLLRGIRYNSDGTLYDSIIEVTIPEVNSYSFVNFTQVADPVTSEVDGRNFLTFKLSAPLTYTGKDCTISLENGTLSDIITFKQLIDSSYSLFFTNENFDIVKGDTETSILFRVYKGKINETNKATNIIIKDNKGVIPTSVTLISNNYYKATFLNSSFVTTPTTISVKASIGGSILSKTLPVRNLVDGSPKILFNNNNNVVTENISVRFSIVSLSSNEVSIKGIFSPVICKVPKYINFLSLLKNEGQVIESGTQSFIPVSSPIVLSVTTTDFILSERIITSNENFNDRINDGNSHNLEFNWLTRSTISQEPQFMNDTSTYTKLSLSQIGKYTPDRVFFPNDGYPQPAVTMNNVIYNSENNYMYESNYWFNDNQKRIYECDKDGKYIVYGLKNGSLSKTTFDYATHFSSIKDLRFNPHQPVYTSCSEWYKSKFYLEKNESNPYWQVIKFADTFNVDTRDFDQIVNIYSYQKGTEEMKLLVLNEGEKFLNIAKAVTATLNNNELSLNKFAEYIDHKNGKLQFVLQQPDDTYRTSSQFIKFGIWASNPFYGNEVFTDNTAVIKLRSILNLSYIVNSTENVSNPLDKDADIVQVSELGIFDEDHNLIAYSTFPPIEYHSKTQHASFICYIKDGTCSDIT